MTEAVATLYHWCPRSLWESASSEYTPAEFVGDGFVHCSFVGQVARTATAIDGGRTDLVLLVIDPAGLDVVVEDCYDAGEAFPHVYGPIPRASVKAVLAFPPEPDGSFELPEPLRGGAAT